MLIRLRMNAIDIEGEGDLVLTRNRAFCTLDMGCESNITTNTSHFNFVGLTQRTRVGRFLFALKYVWQHCK